MTMQPTDEQAAALDLFLSGENLAVEAMARHRALAIPAREVHPATRERLTADRLAVASDGWLAITADGRAVADWLGAS